ncbi:type II toxin-antitoxin system RelE family toxin [Brachyspira catarrhinii]|uniref:Type II toxin-antitoxin system RelE/ParE family toxin n=1 Tax=Brachyspira catarrhinii TaxID=2528966 RepID=A0ABY2TQD0_9SPIR|nr:type II toxin-antitoxin system RelE/ParE family toxin [Brachyspira catarrhinii]TKZ35092.1 type II toxin-antitoxin system RelE/ParE family toxin [Brachyspira catarrhinii]
MEFVFSSKAQKDFKKLDISIQKRIKTFTQEIENLENPRSKGKALTGDLKGFWRYRIGDYRLVCEILDNELIIYTIKISHRKNVYD